MEPSRQSMGSDEVSDFTDKPSDSLLGHTQGRHNRPRNVTKQRLTAVAIHVGIWCLYTAVFAFFGYKWSHRGPDFAYGYGTAYSPAREAIQYQQVQFAAMPHDMNDFRGDPRPEYEAAWNRLLSATNVRVKEEDLHKAFPYRSQEPVKIEDEEGGYLGMLDVMHQLHCLRVIRIAYTPELYPEWAGSLERMGDELIPYHVDHCIDELRQSLMCHADVTLLVSDWVDDYPGPWPNFNVNHNCVNWDNVMQWSIDNHVNDTGKLTHPKYGVYNPSSPSNHHHDE